MKEETMQTQLRVANKTQYIKKIDFDVMKTNYEFYNLQLKEKISPEIKFQIQPAMKKLEFNDYELSIGILAECVVKEKPEDIIYKLEIIYSSIFSLEGDVVEEVKEQLLLTECANLTFPFIRSEIANITMKSGYQPLMMDPINFKQMYEMYKNNTKETSKIIN